MLTNISPATYDPKATCPLWEDFLNDIMSENEDMIAFLQRAAGYTLRSTKQIVCRLQMPRHEDSQPPLPTRACGLRPFQTC